MSKVLDESGEKQLPSTSNTQVINEDGENGQSPSTSNTKVINENGENGQSSSASSTMVNEDGENKQSPSTSNIKVIKAPPKLSRREKLLVLLRVVIMLFIEIALPLILYYVLKEHLGDVRALIISGVPPFLVVIYGFIRNRRIDVLGAMMVITSIVGIILTLLKNDPRFFLLRESVMTGTVGLVFLFTLIPIKTSSFKMRPIIFYFARDMTTGGTFGKKSQNPDDDVSESWDRYWDNYAIFRQGFIVLTIVWGVGLLSEAPVRVVIVFKAPTVERAVFWSNIVTYSWLSVLILFNSIYSHMFKKRCKKEIPKAEAAAAAAANQTSV